MSSRMYRASLALVLVSAAVVAIVNAATFPSDLGYDALAHRTYADLLVHHGRIPSPAESQEFHTPPGFYAIAGVAEVAAKALGASQPWDVARSLNVLWMLGTAILTLLVARLLFPREPVLHVAAVAFVAFVPVVLKLAAMFHPETLSMFASTVCVYLAVRMFVRRSFGWRDAVLLGAALGLAQLVRGFDLWLVPIVVVAFAAAARGRLLPPRKALGTMLVVLAAAAVLAGPWYARQAIHYSTPLAFNRAAPDIPLWRRRPSSFYLGTGIPEVVRNPTRPQFLNEAIPTLYSDVWGDYFGYFSWTTTASGATPVALDATGLRELQAQNVLGLVPTLLAIAGVLGLLRLALRRSTRFGDQAVLVVALLPVFGLAGFVLFAVSYPSGDGDVIKAGYLLSTAPGWAIGFGYAWSRIARTRLGILVMGLACGLALLSDLAFLLHRGPLGPL